MYLRSAIFGGAPPTDAAQLERIFKVCGTPQGVALEHLSSLPYWNERKLKTATEEDLILTSRIKDKLNKM